MHVASHIHLSTFYRLSSLLTKRRKNKEISQSRWQSSDESHFADSLDEFGESDFRICRDGIAQ